MFCLPAKVLAHESMGEQIDTPDYAEKGIEPGLHVSSLGSLMVHFQVKQHLTECGKQRHMHAYYLHNKYSPFLICL